MLFNCLSEKGFQSYNVELAHKIGVTSAIYFNVLVDLYYFSKQQKNEIINEEYIWVDREYVTSRSTFSIEEQLNCESVLISNKLIELSEDKKTLKINWANYIGCNVETQIISQPEKKKSKRSNPTGVLYGVIKQIDSNYPVNVKAALEDWLNTVFDKYGYVNKNMLLNAQKLLSPVVFTELNKALEIINIAIIQAYRDMTWAFKRYDEIHKNDIVKTNINENMDKRLSKDYF